MAESRSPLDIASTAYQIVGLFTGVWMYGQVAVSLYADPDKEPLVEWLLLGGPFLSFLGGALWPMYWTVQVFLPQ